MLRWMRIFTPMVKMEGEPWSCFAPVDSHRLQHTCAEPGWTSGSLCCYPVRVFTPAGRDGGELGSYFAPPDSQKPRHTCAQHTCAEPGPS